MFPKQSSQLPQILIGIVVLVFLVKDPEGAAHAVTALVDAIARFSSAL